MAIISGSDQVQMGQQTVNSGADIRNIYDPGAWHAPTPPVPVNHHYVLIGIIVVAVISVIVVLVLLLSRHIAKRAVRTYIAESRQRE
ncbi:MAG: hypothetical protein NVS3B3_07080 [Aquirhabdus sp.]